MKCNGKSAELAFVYLCLGKDGMRWKENTTYLPLYPIYDAWCCYFFQLLEG